MLGNLLVDLLPLCKSRPTIIPDHPGAENWPVLPCNLCRKQHLTKTEIWSKMSPVAQRLGQKRSKTIKCTTIFSDNDYWILDTHQHLYPSSLLDKWLQALATSDL